MTRGAALSLLERYVHQRQGLKAASLPAGLARALSGPKFLALAKHDVVSLLDELVARRRIIAVHYRVPQLPERVKLFLLPGGTALLQESPQ